jgi:hypothetical protein
MQFVECSSSKIRFIPLGNSVYEAASVELRIYAVYCRSNKTREAPCHGLNRTSAHVVRNLELYADPPDRLERGVILLMCTTYFTQMGLPMRSGKEYLAGLEAEVTS